MVSRDGESLHGMPWPCAWVHAVCPCFTEVLVDRLMLDSSHCAAW